MTKDSSPNKSVAEIFNAIEVLNAHLFVTERQIIDVYWKETDQEHRDSLRNALENLGCAYKQIRVIQELINGNFCV